MQFVNGLSEFRSEGVDVVIRPTERMTREQQHMVGRVINRLRMKPVYATLKYCAEVWGLSIHYISQLSDVARSPILNTRYDS